jgi:hypothetical protein
MAKICSKQVNNSMFSFHPWSRMSTWNSQKSKTIWDLKEIHGFLIPWILFIKWHFWFELLFELLDNFIICLKYENFEKIWQYNSQFWQSPKMDQYNVHNLSFHLHPGNIECRWHQRSLEQSSDGKTIPLPRVRPLIFDVHLGPSTLHPCKKSWLRPG